MPGDRIVLQDKMRLTQLRSTAARPRRIFVVRCIRQGHKMAFLGRSSRKSVRKIHLGAGSVPLVYAAGRLLPGFEGAGERTLFRIVETF